VTSGGVGSALVTAAGHVFTGVCIDTGCSMGFCAEHAAVAEMLKAHEAEVRLIVAVDAHGQVLPPCGRCRELLWQVSDANRRSTIVVLGPDLTKRLDELLPDR
jgi:cytidine deaminase